METAIVYIFFLGKEKDTIAKYHFGDQAEPQTLAETHKFRDYGDQKALSVSGVGCQQ